ncbi:MAG TPA: T9SS type A sorting domain-containing protein [Dongiaceae bacterium]|nr:T9SS type A sorting domain-containing protein [Dongiaceae bacterium]
MWPPNGLLVHSGIGPSIVADGAGGAIVALTASCGGGPECLGCDSTAYFQHVLASGAMDPAWPDNGPALIGTTCERAVTDDAGGAFVELSDYKTGVPGLVGILVERVLAGGSLTGGASLFYNYRCDHGPLSIVPDGAHGVMCAWGETGVTNDLLLVAHHVLGDGNLDPAWPVGGLLVSSTLAGSPALAADGTRGVILISPEGEGGFALVARHVLTGGLLDPAWPGVSLCFSTATPRYATVSDGTGGAIVVWTDYRDGAIGEPYAKRVLAGGRVDPDWPFGGLVLCTVTSKHDDLQIVPDGENGAIVAWQDDRDGNWDIYAQRVPANGGGDLPTAAQVSLITADVREGRAELCWYLSPDRPAALTVYRSVDSGPWHFLATVTPDGSGYVRYEDATVVPGTRYGYRLGRRAADGSETFAGEAWVEVPGADLAVRVPNPVVSGAVAVSFGAPAARAVRVELLDVAGRIVASQQVTGSGARQSVTLAPSDDLAPGVYLVRVGLERPVVARVAVIR